MFSINFCLNMFRASLCLSSGEQRPSYCIWCIVLVLLDVVGSGCRCAVLKEMSTMKFSVCFVIFWRASELSGWCIGRQINYFVTFMTLIQLHKSCTKQICKVGLKESNRNLASARILQDSAPNRYQPHPAEPEQHTKCSNGFFVLLKMSIMMPETCWNRS